MLQCSPYPPPLFFFLVVFFTFVILNVQKEFLAFTFLYALQWAKKWTSVLVRKIEEFVEK